MGMDLLRAILDPYLNNFLIKTQFYFPITKTPFWAWGTHSNPTDAENLLKDLELVINYCVMN